MQDGEKCVWCTAVYVSVSFPNIREVQIYVCVSYRKKKENDKLRTYSKWLPT